MRKYLPFILALFILILGVGTTVLASNTSAAIWSGIVRVTNNSTAATGVSVNFSANTSVYIAGGYMYSSGNNTAIQFGGSDVAYMPGYAGNPWIVYQSSIGASTTADGKLYMGGTTDMAAKIRYFPATGGATVVDSATIESENNTRILVVGQFNTTAGANKYIVNHPNSVNIRVSDTVSGNITATANTTSGVLTATLTGITSSNHTVSSGNLSDVNPADWTSYTELDAGGFLSETGTRVTMTAVPMTADDYLYKNYGAGFFNTVDIDFSMYVTGDAVNPLGGGGPALTNTVNDISGLAATDLSIFNQVQNATQIQVTLIRGASVASDASVMLSANTVYYFTLQRAAGADTAYLYIYSDAARTTLSDTLSVAGFGAVTWQYRYGFINYNTGLANRFITGYVQNGNYFYLDVDGVKAINTTPLPSVGAYDSPANWAFFQNDSMPFVEYAQIYKGVIAGNWVWQYGATFTDLAGNGNIMTPSFRTTSSDADVSAALVGFKPIEEADAPPYTVTDPPPLITANITVSGNFSSNTTGSSTPGVDVITAVAAASGTPVPFLLYLIAGVALLGLSMSISYLMRDGGSTSLVIKILIILGALGVLIAINVFDDWVLYLFAILAIGIAFIASNRQFEGTGNFNNNLLGFLIMAWLGLSVINNILEGVLLTTTETDLLNDITVFQSWNIAGIFNLPVPNIHFITVGIPALMEWDYTAFGGNAQIFTYLMYSVTGVVAFLFFTVAMASAANMFFRSR